MKSSNNCANGFQLNQCIVLNVETDQLVNSDGIARVHGMTNVQAEELVEYVAA